MIHFSSLQLSISTGQINRWIMSVWREEPASIQLQRKRPDTWSIFPLRCSRPGNPGGTRGPTTLLAASDGASAQQQEPTEATTVHIHPPSPAGAWQSSCYGPGLHPPH